MPRPPDLKPGPAPDSGAQTAGDTGAVGARTARDARDLQSARNDRNRESTRDARDRESTRDARDLESARNSSLSATPRLRVAAGILRDAQGRVLLTERLHDHPFAGLWEFPGGKIDGSETPAAALWRELREELDVEVVASELLLTVEHDYPDRSVEIDFFLVTEWRGKPRPMLGQKLRWVTPEAIAAAELLPANAAVVQVLNPEP